MEQFAIWNLLKTMLNNSPSPSSQAAKTAETLSETPSNPLQSSTADTPAANTNPAQEKESPATPPPSQNACEEYLLRHERLMNGRKR